MLLPNLKKVRESKGLTQVKLAEMMCLSERTIISWENGGESTANNAKRLAMTMGVKLQELRG